MKEIFCNSPDELISYLRSEIGECVFRGVPDSLYTLLPAAFRPGNLKRFSEGFPIKENELFLWCRDNAIQESIRGWGGNPSWQVTQRIQELCLAHMRYNYALYEAYRNKPYPMNDNDTRLIEVFESPEYWCLKNTFTSYFDYIYRQLIWRIDLQGNIQQRPHITEEITGLDETYPQHYDFPSTALDWSHDPHVAIRFSLGKESDLKVRYLSVFTLQIIDGEKAPIYISRADNSKENHRVHNQKGAFTFFKAPNRFFLNVGRFPHIDWYASRESSNSPSFVLQKFSLLRTRENRSFLDDYLVENGITEELLFPVQYYGSF